MKYIDISTWRRKHVYHHFIQFAQPHITACTEFDLTVADEFSKQNDIPLFRIIMYAALRSSNEIEEFRYRIRGDKVILHDSIRCSFTVQKKVKTIEFGWVNYKPTLAEFLTEMDDEINSIESGKRRKHDLTGDDVTYLGCTPWSSFTSLTHPLKDSTDSIPRMTWGKYFDKDTRLKMPLSVTIHHSLMDGFHLGQCEVQMQSYLNDPSLLKTKSSL